MSTTVNHDLSQSSTKKKTSSWSAILKLFRELQLPLPSTPETWLEFNTLSEIIHQPKVVVITTKVLNTALKKIDNESRQRARILLTSYVMLMCPSEILQNFEQEQEKKLHDSAKRMLCLFEIWLSAHRHPGATAARAAFVDVWNEYYSLFETWKSRDRDELVENMIAYYVQLSTLRQTMIGQDEQDPLGQQLGESKRKLEKLGGQEALVKLQQALEQSAASTSTGRKRQQENIKPRTPSVKGNVRVHKDQVNELLSDYASSLTNLQLAHELILEPEFSLEKYTVENALEKQVREMAEKAIFDKLVEDIEQGKMDECVPPLIHDMKQRLLLLVPSESSVYKRIMEEIDVDLVKQQIQHNAFDLKSMTNMINYMTDIMSSMCAPVRDSQIKEIRQLVDNPTEQLRLMSHLLDDMSLDLSNFRLRSLRRPLMTIAVDYEREKFADMLNSGAIQLVKTQHWLTEACEHTESKAPSIVFEEAFVSLLERPQVLIADTLPETLMLDVKRMAEFQNEFQANTMVATLLTLTRNFGLADSQALSELGVKLFMLLEDKSTCVDNLAAEIERVVGPVRAERKNMIRKMVDKTLSHTDTVYSILSRRVASVIKSTLHNGRFVTEEVMVDHGLESIQPNLQLLSLHILKLVRHHRQVYAHWYDEILK